MLGNGVLEFEARLCEWILTALSSFARSEAPSEISAKCLLRKKNLKQNPLVSTGT